MAHFIGLLMIIQIPSGLAPLLATGNSSTVAKLFRRYLSTLIHIKSWYESNPYDKTTPAFQSMQKVRSMHRRVQQLMNSGPKNPEVKDKLWLNQYDFVMTQWAFIGPIILYKNKCGFVPASDQDMDHIYYLWRVIGHCMGIEDKYNLCSDDIEVDRELCRMLLDRDYRPILQASDIENNMGWHMGNGIATALRMLNPSISFQAFINYWYPILELPHKPRLDSLFLKFSYYWMIFNFHVSASSDPIGVYHVQIYLRTKVMLRFSIGHWLYGTAYRLLIALAIKRKQIRELVLKNRYKDIKYEVKCPINNIDIQYEDAFDDNIYAF